MKALAILKRVRAARDELAQMDMRIARRREILTSLSAPQADPIGGGRGTTDPDRNGRVMADIDQLERQKAARCEMLEAERMAAVALLDMIPDLESEILDLYYIRGMDTTNIARQKKYTPGYVRKTKRAGEMLLDMLAPERVAETLPAWYLRERGEKG